MTHEQIMAKIPEGTGDKASVRRMDLGDRIWRYELIDKCRDIARDHSHLLCEACGAVSCLPPLIVRTLDGMIPKALQGAEFRIRVMGRCGDCVAA
jgi:Fe2+ or Zn2+ uptake regulation protein